MDRKSWIQMGFTIAVALAGFYILQTYILPKPSPTNTANNAPLPAENGKVADSTPAVRTVNEATTPDGNFTPISRKEAKTFTLQNDFLTAIFSERGGVLETLSFYTTTANGDQRVTYYHTPDDPTEKPSRPLALVTTTAQAPDQAPAALALRLDANDPRRNTSRWSTEGVRDVAMGEQKARSISFRFPPAGQWESDGTAITKTFTLLPLSHRFDIEIKLENNGKAAEKTVGLWGPVGIGIDGSSTQIDVTRISLYGSTQNARWSEFRQGDPVHGFHNRLDDYNRQRGEQGKPLSDAADTVWLDGVDPNTRYLMAHGIKTRFFLAFLASDAAAPDARWSGHVIPLGVAHGLGSSIGVSLVAPELESPAGGSATARMAFYAGPRDQGVLERSWNAAAPKADVPAFWVELAPFGWPGIISGPLSSLLKFLTGIMGPGFAIMLMTLIVRMLLSPLSYRGQKSMASYTRKMKVVKPKLDKIKAKYEGKKDRDSQLAMLTETRLAMKEQNVGLVPLGGCLPIFLQMPIFIGLYATFGGAFFLRQESFLWIRDLSMPDASIPGVSPMLNLPIIGGFLTHNGIFTINILPMLWIGLSVLQMRMQPKPDDPQQAAMQRQMGCIFPIMGLMFYAYASGFALYFIVSSIYSLVETRTIKWWLVKTGVMEPPKARLAGAEDKPEFRGISK
ncbi:MAG: membrane protein insertase YidC [Planctomycetes bacterium]|nr:membrane protein insertase YidC [Planctomycetota bacterium]